MRTEQLYAIIKKKKLDGECVTCVIKPFQQLTLLHPTYGLPSDVIWSKNSCQP